MAIDDNTSYELTGYQVKDLAQKIRAKADSSSLASVATSGLYSDLTGAPTIPTVYNGTLTIQQNGTTLGTFSANQSANETINITGGGGETTTVFYWDAPNSAMYKDSGFTTAVTMSDVEAAASAGPVKIYHPGTGRYEYLVTDRISAGDYFSTVWSDGSGNLKSVVYAYPSNTWVRTSVNVQNELTAGSNITISSGTISATDTTYSDFTGATSSVAGSAGLVPAPTTSDPDKFLKGDGTWGTPASNSEVTTFYWDGSIGQNMQLYSDKARTTAVTVQEFEAVLYSQDRVMEVYDTDADYDYIVVASGPGWARITNGSWLYSITPVQNTNFNIELDMQLQPLLSDFTGATAITAGLSGKVPAPAAGDQNKVLHGDGTWKDTTAKLVEMSYGESNAWAKFIAAYNAGSIVYCRASSNANPGTGSQTRKAFMAYVNNATNPTNVEFQYVRSQSSKTDSQQTDQVFVYTLTNTSGGTWSVASRNMAPKINVDGPITKTFTTGANATITIGASAMTGATSGAAGTAGVVPAPAAGDDTKYLKGNGTWGAAVDVALDYSTSEVDTGHTWVDGSKIYKKTLYIAALPNATTANYSFPNVNRAVKLEGIAWRDSGDCYPLPYTSGIDIASNIDVLYQKNSDSVQVRTGADRSSFEGYVTLYYTKSS